MDSVSGRSPDGYEVLQILTECGECAAESNIVCTKEECGFLCYHMYQCGSTCYDYGNGHICKHIHRVHSLANSDSFGACDESGVQDTPQIPSDDDSDYDPLTYTESIHDIPQSGNG